MRVKRYTSDLRARDWERIKPLILVRRRRKWPLLEVVNGVLYVLKNGCGWRELPGEFPCWNTGHYYFANWGKDGTWENINACLLVDDRQNSAPDEKKTRNPPPSSSTPNASKTRPQPRKLSASTAAN